MGKENGTGRRSEAGAVAGGRPFRDGLKVAFSTAGAILLASSAGFGALASDAGMSLFAAVYMMAVFFALPAQVVMLDQLARGGSMMGGALAVALTGIRLVPMTVTLLPWLTEERPRAWRRLAAAHFIAVTAWLEGMKRLPARPEAERMSFFLGIGTGCFAATLLGSALGFILTGSVSPSIAAGLLFLTPIYFLLSLIAAARGAMDGLAVLFGAVLGPVFYLALPGLDLLATGLIGGTAAYFAGRRIEGLLKDDEP